MTPMFMAKNNFASNSSVDSSARLRPLICDQVCKQGGVCQGRVRNLMADRAGKVK